MTSEPVELESDVPVPVIDGFEIISTAGRGGMGVVYKARQTAFDRIVAIKLLHKHLTGSGTTTVQRFIQEGRLATQLRHPNIGAVLGSGCTGDNQPYLVMEFLEGESLREELQRNGPLDRRTFKEYFVQILTALQCAHDLKIVHRDLKPGNIVLEVESGRKIPKLVDFGIAKLIEVNREDLQKLTQTGSLIGSPTYMSPEQFGLGEVDARSDIYSLGCVMYEAITGKLAFDSDNVMELMAQHIGEVPLAPSAVAPGKLPAGIDGLILKMLAKPPTERYQTCADVLNDLESIDLSSTAAPAKPQKVHRFSALAKSKLFSGMYFALAIMLAALAGWYYLFQNEPVRAIASARAAVDRGDFRTAAEHLQLAGVRSQRLTEEQKTEFAIFCYELRQLLHDEPQAKRDAMNVDRALECVSNNEAGRVLRKKIDLENLHVGRQYPAISNEWMPQGTGRSAEYLRCLMLCERGMKKQEQALPDAVEIFQQALKSAQLADRLDLQMGVWYLLSEYHGGRRDYESTEQCLKEALKLAPEAIRRQPTYLGARNLMNISLQSRLLEDWNSAERALTYASELATKLKPPPGLLADMKKMEAELLRWRKDYPGALAKYQEELKLRSLFGRPSSALASAYRKLGEVYQALGESALATEAFGQSAEVLQRVSQNIDVNFDQEMSLAEKVAALMPVNPGKAREMAAPLLREYRQIIDALEQQVQAENASSSEATFNRKYSEYLRQAMNISIQVKEYKEAESFAMRRLDLNRIANDKVEEAYTLRALFDIQNNLNKSAQALPHLERATEILQSKEKPTNQMLLETETKLAGIYFRNKTYDKAEALLRKIMHDTAGGTNMRRAVVSTVPLTLARICVLTGRKDEAWKLLHDNIEHADIEYGGKQRPLMQRAHEIYQQLSTTRNSQ